MHQIGVGIIGASPRNPGWALAAHVPAVRALPDFELRAVSTSQRASADAAAHALGVAAYDNVEALLAHAGVDLVVVAVKAPDHLALVRAALAAGKMVFCEWPLGASLAEAEDLAARAAAAGVRTVIGLQARFAPAVQRARELVVSGALGEILGTSLVGSGMAWGAEARRDQAYWFDAESGANVLSVPVLHALDAVTYVLGELATVTAATAIRRPTVRIVQDGTTRAVTAPDHIAISGALASGAIASVFYRGATSRVGNLRWEINGTEGDLVITSDNGNLQVADLVLAGGHGAETSVAPIALSDEAGGFGANTLRAYAALADDLRAGTHQVPDFAYALQHHRLLAALETAARTGIAQRITAVQEAA